MIYAGLSEQGKRSRNEDCIYIPQRGEVSLAILADGMGGHNAGSTASSMAVESAQSSVKRGGGIKAEALLRRAAQEANTAVYEHAKAVRECRGMGTTLVMAMFFKSSYTALNIGDSRLYHYKDEGLFQITRDHSYVAEMVTLGLISPEAARNHPQRNIITSALGLREIEKIDVFEQKWYKDEIVMLCSDGLYGVLLKEDMERVLKEEADLQKACETLVSIAAYGGSTDNISVILVKNEEGPTK